MRRALRCSHGTLEFMAIGTACHGLASRFVLHLAVHIVQESQKRERQGDRAASFEPWLAPPCWPAFTLHFHKNLIKGRRHPNWPVSTSCLWYDGDKDQVDPNRPLPFSPTPNQKLSPSTLCLKSLRWYKSRTHYSSLFVKDKLACSSIMNQVPYGGA